MQLNSKSMICGLFLSASASALAQGNSNRVDSEMKSFRVTVKNWTADNRISPFLTIVGNKNLSLYRIGKPASPGVAAIAEMGATDILESELQGNGNVYAVAKASGGPLAPQEARSVTISISKEEAKSGTALHVLAMIGRSNDSFISSTPVQLSQFWGSSAKKKIQLTAQNLDAGSEENTGNSEDFGAGGHPTADAEGFVTYDRGMNLRGNAPEKWSWGSRAAVITVEAL